MVLKAIVLAKVFHHLKKLIFAVEAPALVIAAIFCAFQFARREHRQGNALFCGEGDGVTLVPSRETRRVSQHRCHAASKFAVGDPCKVSRVHPSRIGNQHPSQRAQPGAQKRRICR